MLINWMTSTLQKQQTTNLATSTSSKSTLRPTLDDPAIYTTLLNSLCTKLLEAGVMKQIPDPMAPIQDTFRVNIKPSKSCMIYFDNAKL